jgi:hypothetical protein
MNLRSTKNGLSISTRRFREAASVRTIGSFKGALEQGFSDRISNRWHFSGARFFRPIRLNFRQPGKPFELVRWPRLRPPRPSHYVFSPTIQLTFPFNPITDVFFENHADSRFQWLLSEMNELRTVEKRLVTSSPGGGFWSSLRQVRDYGFREYRKELAPVQGNGARKRTLMLLNVAQLAGTPALARGQQSRVETSWNTPPTLLFTILHAEQRGTRTLNESLISSAVWPSQIKPLRESTILKPDKILVFLRSVFDTDGASPAGSPLPTSLKTVGAGNAVALRQAFLMQLMLPVSRARLALTGGPFAQLSLTFGASKPVDATRRNQSFVPPAVLSYAQKREPMQLQAVVNALRDLRPSQSEAKAPPAPQLPSIENLTSQIRQQLERELRIERERRGL